MLVDPNGEIYRGNAFEATDHYSAKGAAPGDTDRANPVECIGLRASGGADNQVVSGAYSLRVTGYNVPGNGRKDVEAEPAAPQNTIIDSTQQGYALIVTGGADIELLEPPGARRAQPGPNGLRAC